VVQELTSLLDQAWSVFHAHERASYLVQPSVPILFFGHSERYFRSRPRVVTVGLNPSLKEFPAEAPWSRFPKAAFKDGPLDRTAYLSALNEYFVTKPYTPWFSSYEPLLNGMGACYGYDTQLECVALHTDICSVLATDPTWNDLEEEEKAELEPEGAALWKSLITALKPDVVIASVAARHLDKIGELATWRVIYSIRDGRAQPFEVRVHDLDLNGHRALLVFGRAAQKPFGLVSTEDKRAIGEQITREFVQSTAGARPESSSPPS